MGQLKLPWIKSNLLTNIKVKFWNIMRQTNTYPNVCKHLANHPDLLTDSEWQQVGTNRDAFVKKPGSTITRDTYKALQEEIRAMPLRELAHLPEEIQNWARGLMGDRQLQHSIESLIRLQEDHWEALADAANRHAWCV